MHCGDAAVAVSAHGADEIRPPGARCGPLLHDWTLDSWSSSDPEKGANEGTATAFRAANTRGGRIDWIAVSGQWQVISAEIDRTQRDGRTPSDHFPVTAVLSR